MDSIDSFLLEVVMIIGMSHEDHKKLMEARKPKKAIRPRKSRTGVLSNRKKESALKHLDKMDTGQTKNNQVVVDEHVKMNDNYMRTGWYSPKKKRER